MRTVERVLLVLGRMVWLPTLPFAVALLAANLAAFSLNEGFAHPCLIAGVDLACR